ncbi:MAG TPA: hypothetical protein VD767_09035 [Thermomicrobiales bacterium]|nr:hypothetical protein [Thermomicrobiales bacterium]
MAGSSEDNQAFVPLNVSPVAKRRQRKPRDRGWQFWRPKHFSLK